MKSTPVSPGPLTFYPQNFRRQAASKAHSRYRDADFVIKPPAKSLLSSRSKEYPSTKLVSSQAPS